MVKVFLWEQEEKKLKQFLNWITVEFQTKKIFVFQKLSQEEDIIYLFKEINDCFLNSVSQNNKVVFLDKKGIETFIIACKFSHFRPAFLTNEFSALMTRKHNDANFAIFPTQVVGESILKEMFRCFLTTTFEGGRHRKRLQLI